MLKEEEAYAALIKKDPQWLSRPIEELVKIQAVGAVYLATHQKLLKQIKSGQIHLAEADRAARLAEGQAIGEALLDVEVKIGELLPSIEDARLKSKPEKPILPEGYRHKDGMHKASNARKLAANPAAVAAIKAEARANDDIPTKTAVLNKIKLEAEKNRREKAESEGRTKKTAFQMTVEQTAYTTQLEFFLMKLPKTPPKDWDERAFDNVCSIWEEICAHGSMFINARNKMIGEK